MTQRSVCRPLEGGEAAEIVTEGGRITEIRPLGATEEPLPIAAPGLFDLQVNGAGGLDLNGDSPSAEVVGGVVERLRAGLVTAFCPTVVTDSEEAMAARLAAITEACRRLPEVAAAIPCIHIEGPFLAAEDGPRGAHPREHVRPASIEEFLRLQRAAEGRIGLVTLAPEIAGGLDLVGALAAEGILVALGHTGASPEVIREAVRRGARLSTHLGNGAHATLPRHPNYIWEQLGCDELHASFIPDGHHLTEAVFRSMVRAKGRERSILVSDATRLAGMPPGGYSFAGSAVELLPSGRIQLAGTPYLAGSSLELLEGVRNAARWLGVPLADAWPMASANPWRLLGRADRGVLEVGTVADLVTWEP